MKKFVSWKVKSEFRVPKGSEWRKWDLHIQSPLSILNNQFPKFSNGKPDWVPFLQKLESLDMAVIGVTDYFTIEGYKELKKYKEQGRLQNIYESRKLKNSNLESLGKELIERH